MKQNNIWLTFVAFLLSFAMLTACGSNTDEGNSEANNNGDTDADSGADEVVELTYITLTDWEETGLEEVIAAFEEEHQNIKVNLETYPHRNLFETIEVRMGSEATDFDILAVDGPLVANYGVKGYLEPLDDYLSSDVRDKWVDSSTEAGTYDGQLLAAPMNTSTQVLYYNKDMFDELGIDPPPMDVEERWTWEELVDVAKQFKEEGISGFSFHQVDRPYQILALPESLGAQVLSEDGLTASGYTNSEKMVEAAQFYQDLFTTWDIHPYVTPDDSGDYFIGENVAMFLSGTWELGNLEEADFEYGIAPHPYFEDGEVATPTGSWHVGVSSYSNHKEEAALFTEFLTAGEGAEIWFEGNRDVPSHHDILDRIQEDEEFAEFPNNVYRLAAHEAQETAVPRPVTPGYLEWETLLDRAYGDISNGDDPKEVLDEIVEEMDRRLAQYK